MGFKKHKKGDILRVYNAEGKAVLAVYDGFMPKVNHHRVKITVGSGKYIRQATWYLSDSRLV